MKQTIHEKNGLIEIPYPQTRFIIRARRQRQDNLWTVTVFDPSNKEEKKITRDGSKAVLRLLAAFQLNTNIEFH